jgi:hypothetical protein
MNTINFIIILSFLLPLVYAESTISTQAEKCTWLRNLWIGKKVPQRLMRELYCQNSCSFDEKVHTFNCNDYSTSSGVCKDIAKRYADRGWMLEGDKLQYCSNSCDFSSNIVCHTYVESKDARSNMLYESFHSLVDAIVLGNTTVVDIDFNIDKATREVWLNMFYWVAPALLSLIPPMLNQHKFNHVLVTTLFLMVNIVLSFFAVPWSITFHNVVVSLLAHVHSSNSTQLAESLWTLVCMVVVFLGVFVVNPVAQVGVMFITIFGVIGLLYNTFFVKRGAHNSQVLVLMFQLWIMVDLLHYTVDLYAIESLGGAAFAMVLNCIIPNKNNTYWLSNAVFYSRTITMHMKKLALHRVLIFMIGMTFQFVLTLLFRACLGAYCLITLRYRFDGQSIGHGLIAYFCDFFGPSRSLWRLLFKYESFNTRRLFYGVIGMIMLILEFNHCREVFILRFIASFVDRIFIGSSYQKSMKYLGCDIKMQVAFPQRDALPWMNIDLLQSIARTTKSLFVTRKDGKMVKGFACALSVNGRSMLYTVKHVIKDAQSVQFGSFLYNRKFEALTGGDDPVVYLRQDDIVGPSVPIITQDEVHRIVSVASINVHEEGEGAEAIQTSFVCLSTKFHIKDKQLFATISLKKGDSGGPVFAILDDGEIRFAGTVSSGRHDQGGGNIFSFACSHCSAELESSDDDEPNELVSASYFNKRRSHDANIGFHESEEYKAKLEVMDFIRSSDFDSLTSYCKEYGVTAFDFTNANTEEDILLNHNDIGLVAARAELEEQMEQGRRPPDDNVKEYEEEFKQKKKNRVKNWKKERANKKRRFIGLSKTYIAKLLGSYERSLAATIFYESLRGGVPSCSPTEVIAGFEGGWLFAD